MNTGHISRCYKQLKQKMIVLKLWYKFRGTLYLIFKVGQNDNVSEERLTGNHGNLESTEELESAENLESTFKTVVFS